MAYRELAEKLQNGGVNIIGKQHFTFLYNQARHAVLTPHNIKSGWAKTSLYLFNPNRVLRDVVTTGTCGQISQTTSAKKRHIGKVCRTRDTPERKDLCELCDLLGTEFT
jgi:hypothetical protein